jgi:hypothetical protein
MTTMTRPADNTIAKKSGVVIPATAAATRETKAKGTATLASSDTQSRGFVILVLALSGELIGRARPGPFWAWRHVRRPEGSRGPRIKPLKEPLWIGSEQSSATLCRSALGHERTFHTLIRHVRFSTVEGIALPSLGIQQKSL